MRSDDANGAHVVMPRLYPAFNSVNDVHNANCASVTLAVLHKHSLRRVFANGSNVIILLEGLYNSVSDVHDAKSASVNESSHSNMRRFFAHDFIVAIP